MAVSGLVYAQEPVSETSLLKPILQRQDSIFRLMMKDPPWYEEDETTGLLRIGEEAAQGFQEANLEDDYSYATKLLKQENAARAKLFELRVFKGRFASAEAAALNFAKSRAKRYERWRQNHLPALLFTLKGSPDMARSLLPMLVSKHLSRKYPDAKVSRRVRAYGDKDAIYVEAALGGKRKSVAVRILLANSTDALQELKGQSVRAGDLVCMRGWGRSIQDLANLAGPELKVTPIALDGVAFVVNHRNPVRQISVGQIKKIVRAETRLWKSVDSNGKGAITLALLGPKSEPADYLKSMLGGDLPVLSTIKYFDSIDEVESFVFKDRTALGILPMDLANQGEATPLKIVSDRNSERSYRPTLLTISKELYPFIRYLTLISRGGRNELYDEFLSFVKSPAGAKIIFQTGFVPASRMK